MTVRIWDWEKTRRSRASAEQKCGSRILSFPRLGGLHHRYDRLHSFASSILPSFPILEETLSRFAEGADKLIRDAKYTGVPCRLTTLDVLQV